MSQTLIEKSIVENVLLENNITNIGQATIRQIQRVGNVIEEKSKVEFIRLEIGVPGLPVSKIGIDAQKTALDSGVAAIYPPVEGIPELRKQTALFVKNFLDIDVKPETCLPTVGSMQAGFATFMTVNRMDAQKEGTLFIDPGFPVQKVQCKILGQPFRSFDIYEYRGEKLRAKLEEMCADGKVSSILYSNPNNPAWFCLTDEELQIIGDIANKYNIIVIEDLAYFGMDFRSDYGKPGVAPYQPSVAKYTDNYILFISASKAFSYAGERIAMMIFSDKTWNWKSTDLLRYYGADTLGNAFLFGALYALTSGVAHSVQYGFTAILKAANEGKYNFLEDVKIYGEKAKEMKKIFIDNGFEIVYDKDGDEFIADGFYFTVIYPGYTGNGLLGELLHYGITAIPLETTGSTKEGLRICVSLIPKTQFPELEKRLKMFHEANKK